MWSAGSWRQGAYRGKDEERRKEVSSTLHTRTHTHADPFLFTASTDWFHDGLEAEFTGSAPVPPCAPPTHFAAPDCFLGSCVLCTSEQGGSRFVSAHMLDRKDARKEQNERGKMQVGCPCPRPSRAKGRECKRGGGEQQSMSRVRGVPGVWAPGGCREPETQVLQGARAAGGGRSMVGPLSGDWTVPRAARPVRHHGRRYAAPGAGMGRDVKEEALRKQ